jgi:N-acyl-D-amino-acid deacylase
VNITADLYPYTYWQSNLSVLLPERNFDDRAAAQLALDEIATPDGLLLTAYAPEPSYVGKTVAEIARIQGRDPTTTYLDLVKRAESFQGTDTTEVDGVIGTSMTEADVERLMTWPYANFCTDGSLVGRHPRGSGSFPRILGRYVREGGILTLPEAVRKLSGLAASNMGIRDRGRIAPGMQADLVLFDPKIVLDRSTLDDPAAVSEGIRMVWVNGTVVYREGKPTGAFPGRVIRR